MCRVFVVDFYCLREYKLMFKMYLEMLIVFRVLDISFIK